MGPDISTAAKIGMGVEREVQEVQDLSAKMLDAIGPVIAGLPFLRVVNAATHMVGSMGSSSGPPEMRAALLRGIAAALLQRAAHIERRPQ